MTLHSKNDRKVPMFRKAWFDTSYQQAIWRARKRLAGKVQGEISPLESKILSENLLSISKPDYSRWMHNDVTRRRKVASRSLVLHNSEAASAAAEERYQGPRTSAVEFLSVVDQAPICESPLPYHRSAVDVSTSYDNFGLCVGCFHRRGPHHHYHAPVRIGGGFTIYHRQRVPWFGIVDSEIKWNTRKWLSEIGKSSDVSSTAGFVGFGDDYSVKLFEQFISNGGDASALKEYLDSNFNESVLGELEESGVNVQIIREYTEMYRNHLKSLLKENIQQQSELVEEQGKVLEYAVMFTNMENDGADMKMLVTLLKNGRNDGDIIKFEEDGGNLEILEHFAQEITNQPFCNVIIGEFENLLRKRDQYQTSQTFINYLKGGGELKILKSFSKADLADIQEIMSSLENDEAELLIEVCVSHFSSVGEFIHELKRFLQHNFHLYQGAKLLQDFIENEGSILTLKQFVRADCNTILVSEKQTDEETNTELLQRVGSKFLKDPTLKKVLEEFPEDPELISVYIQTGGSFPFLVQAVSDAAESPRLKKYVQQETNRTIQKIANEKQNFQEVKTEIIVSVSNKTKVSALSHSSRIPRLILPRVLEKAKAGLLYDELVEAKNSLKENEGVCLSKTVDLKAWTENSSFPVNRFERQQVTHLYRSLISPNASSSVSSITGRRRKKLWTAPKPFEIKQSEYQPTQPQSPFTQRRIFQISSLTEDHIVDAARQQRRQLDVLRRNFRIEEFQKHWELSITSPRGSIVLANSKSDNSAKESLLNRVIAKIPTESQQQANETASPPASKHSRRQQQREKMRAVKRGSSEGRRSPGMRRSRSPQSTHLSVPAATEIKIVDGFPDQQPAEQDSISNELLVQTVKDTSEIFLSVEEDVDVAEKDEEQAPELEETTRKEKQPELPRSPPLQPQLILGDKKTLQTPQSSLASSVDFEPRRSFEKPIISPRFATAFGPKLLTSSYSNFLSANTMRKMRDDPETMIGSLEWKERVTSKSESNLADHMLLVTRDDRKDKMLAKEKSKRRKHKRKVTLDGIIVSDPLEEELVDLLKQYCIIREERVPTYRRIFDKYVLIKSIRDRERALTERRNTRRTYQDDDELSETNSVEADIRKNEFHLEKIREDIKEIRQQIAIAKSEVNKAVLYVASRKNRILMDSYEDTAVGRNGGPEEDRERSSKTFASWTTTEVDSNLRRECQSSAEVRDRKVVLIHLREKVRSYLSREKALQESSKRLLKRLEQETLDKGLKQRETHQFVRKQSSLYQELHPLKEEVIEPCDMREALNDLDRRISFFDHTQILEDISKTKGITFRMFCVIAALQETESFRRKEAHSLNSKINICKEHYINLLGPGLDTLSIELEAAGITEKQKVEMVRKLSRTTSGRLEFLDFVTYVPLFLDIHSKIVANPLPV